MENKTTKNYASMQQDAEIIYTIEKATPGYYH
jgi:hypothetical protein